MSPLEKDYCDNLFKEKNFSSPKDWYLVCSKDFDKKILKKYSNSFIKLLQTVYPEYDLKAWLFKRVPKGMWEDKIIQQNFCDWLLQKLGYKNIEDWYKVSQKDFLKHKGRQLLKKYNESHIQIIKNIYFSYPWKDWLFYSKSKNFWNDYKNHKLYCDWLFIEQKFKTIEDWYTVTQKTFNENNGTTLLKKFNDSPSKLLNSVYPSYDWKEWLFSVCPNKFWESISNHKRFCDWLFEKLGYICMEDWYKINHRTIHQNKGGGLLANKYGDSPFALLKAVYPNYSWHGWLFSQAPVNFWENIENKIEYCKWLYDKLGYKCMEDWYLVDFKDFKNNFGGGLLDKMNDSFISLLRQVYPNYNWNLKKFYFKNFSQKALRWLEKLEKEQNIKIIHAGNEGEIKIKNSKFKADGYCKETNTIYEFQGCFYHGCPTCFPERSKQNPMLLKTYQDLYNKTLEKTKHILEQGFTFVEIWEHDFIE